jgi:uncharacterized RDD family membrane protein YckC
MIQTNPTVDILTEEYIPTYATFWNRFAAAFIDGLILFVISIGLQAVLPLGLYYVAGIVIDWLYFALQESGANQATIGKKAMGIKVTGLQGERISFANATGRYFAKIISGIILFIGYLMMLWDEKKQTLHDKMAGTLVVLGKA